MTDCDWQVTTLLERRRGDCPPALTWGFVLIPLPTANGCTSAPPTPAREVLHVGSGEASQDRFGVRSTEVHGGGVADHLVILLSDQVPSDQVTEHRLQRWPPTCGAGLWCEEALRANALQSWQEGRRRFRGCRTSGLQALHRHGW